MRKQTTQKTTTKQNSGTIPSLFFFSSEKVYIVTNLEYYDARRNWQISNISLSHGESSVAILVYFEARSLVSSPPWDLLAKHN